jgi:hypothetical protein
VPLSERGPDAFLLRPPEDLGWIHISDRDEIKGNVMIDFYSALGYLSGVYFINPDIDASTLIRTVSIIHVLDAILCRLIAIHSGRNKNLWTVSGLVLGIWALGALFIFAGRHRGKRGVH